MKFTVSREALLRPLQPVAGVVERRQTLPILANAMIRLSKNELSLTGTDLEVEFTGRLTLQEPGEDGEVTVPARKLLDICKSLPDAANISFSVENQRVTVKSGRSRFVLSTLPAEDFPCVEESPRALEFRVSQKQLKRLIERTMFSMAQQDVRYYLNGMLFEISANQLKTVATDGHRLAMCSLTLAIDGAQTTQAIVPRKGVVELARLLSDSDDEVSVLLGASHLRVSTGDITFTSKLVDGKFPDYDKVLPRGGHRIVIGSREDLRAAFHRASILSNEKYRGVRLQLSDGLMTVVANNPEQEEAEEQLVVNYAGGALEIGFNVNYLVEVLDVLRSNEVKLTLSDANSSALLEESDDGDSVYVVMPMRL